MKKLTVIGIMGKTQGVNSVSPPHSIAVNRKVHSPAFCGACAFSRPASTDSSTALYSLASAAGSSSGAVIAGGGGGGAAAEAPRTRKDATLVGVAHGRQWRGSPNPDPNRP